MSKTDITFDRNKLQYFPAKKSLRELGVADIEEHCFKHFCYRPDITCYIKTVLVPFFRDDAPRFDDGLTDDSISFR